MLAPQMDLDLLEAHLSHALHSVMPTSCSHSVLLPQMDLDLLEAYLSHIIESGDAAPRAPSSTQGPTPPLSPSPASPPPANPGLSSPSQLCVLVTGLGAMAAHAAQHGSAWRPRSSLLGPFMARLLQVSAGVAL